MDNFPPKKRPKLIGLEEYLRRNKNMRAVMEAHIARMTEQAAEPRKSLYIITTRSNRRAWEP